MTLKTIGSICLAALLAFGLAGDASAQTVLGSGEGGRVKITSNSNGDWLGIDDSLKVDVEFLGTLSLTEIIVMVTTDSTVTSGDMSASFDDGVPSSGTGATVAGEYVSALSSTAAITGHASYGTVTGQTSFKKVTFSFQVTASSAANSTSTNLYVFAELNDGTDQAVFGSHQDADATLASSDPTGSTFGFIGEGKSIGIDSNRPVAGSSISNLAIDLDIGASKIGALKGTKRYPGGVSSITDTDANLIAATLLSSGNPLHVLQGQKIVSFKDGSTLAISFDISNPPTGTTATVNVARPTDLTTASDSSIVQFTFTSLELLTNTSLRDSVVLSSSTIDDVGKKTIADNTTALAVLTLVDQAGNDSHPSNENAAAASGVTSPLYVNIDITAPTYTGVVPKAGAAKLSTAAADSSHFTTALTASPVIGSLTNGTATTNAAQNLRPLEFKTSEALTELLVQFKSGTKEKILRGEAATSGDTTQTANLDVGVIAKATAKKLDLTGMDATFTTQAGHKGTLTVILTDTAGNETKTTVSNATLDAVAPLVTDAYIFPTAAGAPQKSSKPTINSTTADPVITLSEALDSVGVQYVEKTAASPDVATKGIGGGDASLSDTDNPMGIALSPDSLITGKTYQFQVFMQDKAGNIAASSQQELSYDNTFANPEGTDFKVAVDQKKVIAGQAMKVTVTALDSAQTKTAGSDVVAVTYESGATLSIVVPGETSPDLTTFSFVTEADTTKITDNKDGTATIAADAWSLGVLSNVVVKSTKTFDKFIVKVDNLVADAPFDGQTADTLAIEASDFRAFQVEAREDGVAATGVSGDFTIWVQPTDEFGNPSSKLITQTTGSAANPGQADSLKLLGASIDSANILGSMFVQISANHGDAQVPQGPQEVLAGGSSFGALSPNRSGSDLVISVRYFSTAGDTSGIEATAKTRHQAASGSTAALGFAAEGEAPPTPAGTIAAPANLIVQDWAGADGNGDQGGFVVASFPSVDGADRYRIWREISVTTAIDASGNVVAADAANAYVAWTVLDNIPTPPAAAKTGTATVQRAVIPTLDTVATNWAVTAEKGGTSSQITASAKRVFSKQIVQGMISFLGVDPNRVLSSEELQQVFSPSEDYVASIIGDRGDVQFGALEIDLSALFGNSTVVPQNIRTQGGVISSSARTVTDGPVKAVDNIPPAAVLSLDGTYDAGSGSIALEWPLSSDDRVVGSMPFRGFSVPIDGVDRYVIMRGADAESLVEIGSVSGGGTTFTDTGAPADATTLVYRVDAADFDNAPAGPTDVVQLLTQRVSYASATGTPVFIVSVGGTTPFVVDFEDFLDFATSFGTSEGQPGFLFQADTNDDGTVNFTDFLSFANSFGAEAVPPEGMSTKPARLPLPGVNDNVELSLNLGNDKVLAGEIMTVSVSLANATALTGFGFDMLYDADKFEFVEASPADESLMSTGGDEPLALTHQENPGELTIANAILNGTPVTGEGEVVNLTFRVLQEFEDNARFEIAEGIVFDPSSLSNPVVALGSLNVETTPTEFALLQNFPNPFNPETTIKYNLAEQTTVSLRIYNVVGQVVRSLVSEPQSAGRYSIRWNGTDDRGVSVSSGIYFYELRSGSFQDVKKLMLLK